jgi:molecular chaperone DnaK (HSP70)
VTFDIDANGILSVTAKDKGSGKEQSITITGASTLPKEEVERMVNESEQNASADKEKREKIDLKNQSDSLCYQSEKQLAELGDKVTEEDKTKIEDTIKELKQAVQEENYETMKSISEKLQNSLMEIGKKVYETNSPNGQAEEKKNDDSVIDADFSETK